MPVADARILTRRNQVGEYRPDTLRLQENAQQDYVQMRADNAAQAEIDAQGVQGNGLLAKSLNAIKGSPQLQSGLMAAGLSLLTGGDAASAVEAGFSAADNFSTAKTAADDKKTAEATAQNITTGKLDDVLSQIDLRSRQPDRSAIEAESIRAGAADRLMSMEYLKLLQQAANDTNTAVIARNQLEPTGKQDWSGFPYRPVQSAAEFSPVMEMQDVTVPGVGKAPLKHEFYPVTQKQLDVISQLVDHYGKGAGKTLSGKQLRAQLQDNMKLGGFAHGTYDLLSLERQVGQARREAAAAAKRAADELKKADAARRAPKPPAPVQSNTQQQREATLRAVMQNFANNQTYAAALQNMKENGQDVNGYLRYLAEQHLKSMGM